MELLHSKQELLGLSCRERTPHLKSRGHEEMCVSGPQWLVVTWSRGVESISGEDENAFGTRKGFV